MGGIFTYGVTRVRTDRMIYYVEDDMSIRELVLYTLRNTGFQALGFEDGKSLFTMIKAGNIPRLILLDIMLSEEDGLDILKKLREDSVTRKIPVIMVTAKDTEYDKVTGLDLGADDYIAKPFGMMELVARIKAVLRRTDDDNDDKEIYELGPVSVDVKCHVAKVNGEVIELTHKEFELLLFLMKHPGEVFTRDALLELLWDYSFTGETRTVDAHIRTLRMKLGEGADIIETVRGTGYKARVKI